MARQSILNQGSRHQPKIRATTANPSQSRHTPAGPPDCVKYILPDLFPSGAHLSLRPHGAESLPEIVASGDSIFFKTYRYAVRPFLALLWVHRYGEPPPMDLPTLLCRDIVAHEVHETIMDLVDRKAVTPEQSENPLNPRYLHLRRKTDHRHSSALETVLKIQVIPRLLL
jgi:RNA repair pathway DNA polymerase beta family protein